jgi:hypothetical protein
VSTQQEAIPERVAFGKLVRQWFKRNGWPQDVPHRLAKFTGAAGPWNSQVSQVMQGKLDPKPAFFVAFGAFNRAVAEQDFRGVTDRRLLDQLKDASPLCDDRGQAYDAPGLFALFTGLAELPESYPAIPEISDQEAKSRSEMARKGFQEHAQDLMLSPREAWEQVARFTENMNDSQLARFKEVLSGWSDWTGEELMAMATDGAYCEPGAALDRWVSESGSWGVRELAREAKRAIEQL